MKLTHLKENKKDLLYNDSSHGKSGNIESHFESGLICFIIKLLQLVLDLKFLQFYYFHP